MTLHCLNKSPGLSGVGGLKGKYGKKAAAGLLAGPGEQTTAGVCSQPAWGSHGQQGSEVKLCSLYGLVAGGLVDTEEVTAGQTVMLRVRDSGRRTPCDCGVARAERGQRGAKETESG